MQGKTSESSLSFRFLLGRGQQSYRLLELYYRLFIEINIGHPDIFQLVLFVVELHPPAFDWAVVVGLRTQWRQENTKLSKNMLDQLWDAYMDNRLWGPGTGMAQIHQAFRDVEIFRQIAHRHLVQDQPLKKAIAETRSAMGLKLGESAIRKIWTSQRDAALFDRKLVGFEQVLEAAFGNPDVKQYLERELSGPTYALGFPKRPTSPQAVLTAFRKVEQEGEPFIRYFKDVVEEKPLEDEEYGFADIEPYITRASRFLKSCEDEVKGLSRPLRKRPGRPPGPSSTPVPGR